MAMAANIDTRHAVILCVRRLASEPYFVIYWNTWRAFTYLAHLYYNIVLF